MQDFVNFEMGYIFSYFHAIYFESEISNILVEEKGNCFSSRQAQPPPHSPPRQSASAQATPL